MDPVQGLLSILGGFLAGSGGFWVYLKRKQESKNANTSLIMGLAHDKIVYLGMKYIEKGFVTKDEYDDLIRYFYEPYVALGGDGSAERIMQMVQILPLTLNDTRITDSLQKGADAMEQKIKEDGGPFDRRNTIRELPEQ